MGKITLKTVGNEKGKTLNLVKKLTGVALLRDALEIVNNVETGIPFTIDVQDGMEKDIIDQFSSFGALAILGEHKFIEEVNEIKSDSKDDNLIDPNLVSSQGREETLKILYEVGKVAETSEILNNEIATLRKNIDIENEKAEDLRHVVSTSAKLIKWIAILFTLIFWLFFLVIGVVITIIVWIVMNKTVIKNDLKKHEEENNAKATKYIFEHVRPLENRLQEAEIEIEQLKKSGKISWAKDIVGENMFYSSCVGDLYDLVKNRRADNLKEALNLYDDAQYKLRMEERQVAIQNASEVTAAEAVKQTAYSKEIAKSSHQAATAAKATAYHTRQIDKNTRRFR